jgi:large subunit ribosomal protein L29
MAIIRLKEIQAMSSEDRMEKLVDLRVELARLRTMIKAGGAVDNPTKVRELRKTIAQILTVENESKLGIRKGAEEKEEKPKKAEKPAKKSKAKEEAEEPESE